jgi:hypothetical protein
VRELSGSCPALRFRLGSTSILTDGATKYKGGNCRALRNGVEVEVEGVRQTDGTVLAQQIGIDR